MKSLSVFRSESGTVRQRYSYLMITSLLMVIGICCYYFYFLSLRADALEERNVRLLDRVENNLTARFEAYRNAALSRVEATVRRLDDQLEYSYFRSLDKSFGAARKKADALSPSEFRYNLYLFAMNSTNRFDVFVHDSLQKVWAQVKRIEEWEQEHPELNEITKSVRFDTLTQPGPIATLTKDPYADSLFRINVQVEWRIGSHNIVVEYDFSIPISVVVGPALRRDIFNNYMILRDDKIIYESSVSGLLELLPDTSAKDESSLFQYTNRSGTLTIEGRKYMTYAIGFGVESGHAWKLMALKDAEEFSGDLRTVPRRYLFAVFIGIIFLVLSVPFIKSLIMSRTERLGTSDVIFSAFSLAVTISIVAVLMMDGYMNSDLDHAEETKQLEDLSQKVEGHLMKEISSVVTELYHFTSERRDSVNTDWWYTGDWSEYEPVVYKDFNDLYLVDSFGFSMYNVASSAMYYDVSERAYFREIMDGRCMSNPGVQAPFYLEAVFSKSEQQFRAIVSTPLPDSLRTFDMVAVAAMSVRLKSLTGAHLNPGTGFIIFDDEGDVCFHSDTILSLNENLVEECGNDPLLVSAINGRTEWTGELDYATKECRMHVRPLTGTPYLIATYSYQAPRDAIHGQVFGSAFLLQILLFVFYIAVIFASLFFVRKASRLRKPFISLSSFIPDVDGNERYLDGILFNLGHIVVLLVTTLLLDEPLGVIILYFISVPYTVLFNTLELSTDSFRGLVKSTKAPIVWVYGLVVIGANAVVIAFVDAWWLIMAAQVLMIVIYYLVTSVSDLFGKTGWLSRIGEWSKYRLSYAGLILVLALLACILPVTTFSILAYNKEKEIQVKVAQLNFLHQREAQQLQMERGKKVSYGLGNYYNPYYSTYLLTGDVKTTPVKHSSKEYDNFSAAMRGHVQEWGRDQNRLQFGAADRHWEWSTLGDDQLVLKANVGPGCGGTTSIGFMSAVPEFHLPVAAELGWETVFKFWIMLLVSVVLLVVGLFFFVNKLFLHEKYSRQRGQNFDQTFFGNIKSGHKIFVTGVPSAGKSTYFAGLAKNGEQNCTIDFVVDTPMEASLKVDDALNSNPGLVIFDHFEHNLLDPDHTDLKLELLEKMVANKAKKVIVISAVQPVVFLNVIDSDGMNKTVDANDNDRRYERWSRVLAAFYDFIYPLQGYATSVMQPVQSGTFSGELKRFVQTECNNGVFLRSIGEELVAEIERRKADLDAKPSSDAWMEREEFIVRIQKLAENYYRSIWDNLAVEEQFVLYDLAQDGLINAKNQDIVESLIDKGLVKYEKRLRIMNRSFRNFILCIAGPSEIGEMEKKVRQTGAWNKLKWPLLLVVCAMLLFVIKSDRSQLFGVFTAITALIPVVVGLFTVFSQFGKKE